MLFSCCIFLSNVSAQDDFKTPQEVENTSKPSEFVSDTDETTGLVIDPNSPIVFESLKGIWIHPSDKGLLIQVEPFHGVRIQKASEVSDTLVYRDLLESYLNKSMTQNQLKHLINEIIVYYREHDYPLVDVYLPEQDVTDGVLQIVVVESVLDKIEINGNEHFTSEYISSVMRSMPGDLAHMPTIFEDTNWLSQNPFLKVQPLFIAGDKPGSTNMILDVTDKRPLRIYSSYANSGNELIGINQFSMGVNYGNLWNKGHQINYQYTRAEASDALNAHAVSYLIPINKYRHNLALTLSTTRTHAKNAGLVVDGESDELSAHYKIPLPELENSFQHDVSLGYEYKRSRNALEFGFVPISDATIEIGQVVINYNGEIKDDWGGNSFNFSLVKSIPGMWSNQDNQSYQAVRAGADADYTVSKFGYQRQTPLPYDYKLTNALNAQFSNSNLVSNEQLSVTGSGAIRGYDSGEFNNIDNGYVLRNDLISPAFSFWQRDQWRANFFIDYASFSSLDDNLIRPDGTVASSDSIWSAGLGVQMQVKDLLSIKAEYGRQLTDTNTSKSTGNFHIQAMLQFY